jgi:hypothetical protein
MCHMDVSNQNKGLQNVLITSIKSALLPTEVVRACVIRVGVARTKVGSIVN